MPLHRASPGPWVDVTLATGWTHFAAGRGVQVRRRGTDVDIRGVAAGSGSATAIIATLPAEYRPGSDRYSFAASCTAGVFLVNVTPDGTVSTTAAPTSTFVYVVGTWSTL